VESYASAVDRGQRLRFGAGAGADADGVADGEVVVATDVLPHPTTSTRAEHRIHLTAG
jgi:hypothetical protein